MSVKTDTEVIIGGKVFTLSGYESEEYLQKVAMYINNKMAEYNRQDGFKRLPIDTQSVLLQLNIADDYFKAKKQIETLEEEIQGREKDMYDLKHELIAAQIKLENAEKEAQALGWDSRRGNLWDVAEGCSIGGDRFGNYEGQLPEKKGRRFTECDIGYDGGYRGAERLIFTNDGLMYYTADHYKTFDEVQVVEGSGAGTGDALGGLLDMLTWWLAE